MRLAAEKVHVPLELIVLVFPEGVDETRVVVEFVVVVEADVLRLPYLVLALNRLVLRQNDMKIYAHK